MLYFVLGVPGEFTEWCSAAAVQLAGMMHGSPGLISANTLEEISFEVIAAGTSHAVVSSTCPGGGLRAALAEADKNFIVACQDYRSALYSLVNRGVDFADAVRAVASSCATLIDCRGAPGALLLTDAEEKGIWQVATAIAHHFHLMPQTNAVADTVPVRGTQDLDYLRWWDGLDISDQELAVHALAPFIADDAEAGFAPIVWDSRLFAGQWIDEQTAGPIDITGRARCLLQGPYITLPPGAWQLALSLSFSPAAAEHDFQIEIHADRELTSTILRPPQDGPTTVHLSFTIDRLTEAPVSVRLRSLRAAFDGMIEISQAVLYRDRDDVAGADQLTAA